MERSDMEKGIKPKDSFATKAVGGELVAINMETGEYHTFNAVGGAIWEALDEGIALEGVVERVTQRFSVDQAKAVSETQEFIKDLLQQGLLEEVE